MLENFLSVARARRSVRSYQSKPVDSALLRQVVETGLLAPYAGEPTVCAAVVTNRPLLDRISAAAKRVAAGSGIPHLEELGRSGQFQPLYGAPVLVLLSDTADGICPDINCAAAAENILLAAQAAQLGGCWIYFALMAFQGADGAELSGEIQLPLGHKPCVALVLGWPADSEKPALRPMDRVHWIE